MGRARRWIASCLIALVAGCSGDGESADRVICEAIASVDTGSTAEDAGMAVRVIKQAGSPESDVLVRVQDEIQQVDDQLALAARFDDLAAACAGEGVDLDLPSEQP